MIENDIFFGYLVDLKKLDEYGFICNDNIYSYFTIINNFKYIVTYNEKIIIEVYDLDTGFLFNNYRTINPGNFSSFILDNVKNILFDIREKCFFKREFVGEQANRVSDYIFKIYGDRPYYAWDSTVDAVFRNSETNKWYGLIMNISSEKLGLSVGRIDVLNIKLDPLEIDYLVSCDGYYRAYHMNKKYWISIILNDTVDDNTIMNLVEKSYNFSCKKNKH